MKSTILQPFQDLLESAPDAMVIVNETGEIVLINSQTEALFGYTREERLGLPVEMLLPGHFPDPHLAHRTTYFRDPRLRPTGAGLALRAVRKDGTEFPVEISLSLLKTAEGLLVTAAIRDITEDSATRQVLWTSARLEPLSDRGLKSVSCTFPAATLKRQNYLVRLSGIRANGTSELVTTNAFRAVVK